MSIMATTKQLSPSKKTAQFLSSPRKMLINGK
jgi:hypothetical protein